MLSGKKQKALPWGRLFCALTLAPLPAFAGPFGAPEITLSARAMHYDSVEIDGNGNRLNRESGWLPGIGARLRLPLRERAYFALQARYFGGDVDYDGQTQRSRPFKSTTDQRLSRWRVEGGYCWWSCQFTANAGAALYRRERDIRGHSGVQGLYEDYRWQEWHLGGALSPQRLPRMMLTAEVFYLRDADMLLDLTYTGGGKPTVPLPNETGLRLGWAYTVMQREAASLSVSVAYERLDIRKSDTRSVSSNKGTLSFFEPASESEQWQLGLQVTF